jgi:hypothetical protein
MKTNRDLYKSIEGLLKEKSQGPVPSLEDYLSNLLTLSHRLASRSALSLDEFFDLLQYAFDGAAISALPMPKNSAPAFEKWHAQIEEQIQDLREMAQQGQLKNEYRYFGVSAPSGRYWYNFDPCTYIECGAAGSLGGWEEGDDTGRSYVPGPVACIGPDGEIISCDPRELDRAPVEISSITWEIFSDFAWCGQNYE